MIICPTLCLAQAQVRPDFVDSVLSKFASGLRDVGNTPRVVEWRKRGQQVIHL